MFLLLAFYSSCDWYDLSCYASLYFTVAEYNTLCPGGEGFRPNPITIILEGEFIVNDCDGW